MVTYCFYTEYNTIVYNVTCIKEHLKDARLIQRIKLISNKIIGKKKNMDTSIYLNYGNEIRV